MWLLVVGIFLFLLLVVLHEYGHFLAAKRNGVEAEEFGIGFPPRMIGKTMGRGIFRTYYSINWLPLGGFVKMKGENDAADEPGSFGAASLRNKAKILLAGVFMNLVAAAVIFTILAVIGMPRLIENQFTISSDTKVAENKVFVGDVADGSPAQKAGLARLDQITSINGQKIENSEWLINKTPTLSGQTVEITYLRDSELQTTTATLLTKEEVEASRQTDDPKGYLGVLSPTDFVVQKSTWSAPITGIGLTAQTSWLTFKGIGTLIGSLFKGDVEQAKDQVSGPLGIGIIIKRTAKLGIGFILMLIALLSVGLAVMNVLPIPALDGGRLFLILLYRVLRKPLTKKTEERIVGVSMAFLLGLMVLITIVDVGRI